ncbi:MAG: hypothetical protein PUE13_02265 [Clostridiales bacterium]|nr:hypothetical protein [Clostridiales bacterium]
MGLKNNDNKSLFLYTSLIFLVAIIMIIVSFFAQTHLEQSKVSEQDAEKVSLSDKAAQVSEENMQLVELNKTLREANEKLISENSSLTEERDSLSSEVAGYEALMAVYDKLYEGNKKSANELLQNIYTEDLSPTQKEFYDILVKKAQ